MSLILWPCSFAITSTGRVGLWFCGFLCPGTPDGSTGSGSGFKASQKTRPRHKYLDSLMPSFCSANFYFTFFSKFDMVT